MLHMSKCTRCIHLSSTNGGAPFFFHPANKFENIKVLIFIYVHMFHGIIVMGHLTERLLSVSRRMGSIDPSSRS